MKSFYLYLVASLFSMMSLSAAPSTGLKFSATSNASIITLPSQAAFSPHSLLLKFG